MKIENVLPADIEKRSFEIISENLQGFVFKEEEEPIIKRCIHTSADFDYAKNMYFSENAVKIMQKALKNGAHIVTDTKMAMAGISKPTLKKFGGEVHCFISDEDVVQKAKERGVTRSFVSMEKAAELKMPLIFAIGNAPTALLSLYELIKSGKLSPVGIIAVPVGFVNVVESKELIRTLHIPIIAAMGRKGGSTIAAAICNALMYSAK